MLGVTQRPGSRFWQFEARVPADVLERLAGHSAFVQFDPNDLRMVLNTTFRDSVRCSLQTSDLHVANQRALVIQSYLQEVYANARLTRPARLTASRVNQISGEAYRLFVSLYAEDPESREFWNRLKATNRMAREGRSVDVPPLSLHDLRHSIATEVLETSDVTASVNEMPSNADRIQASLERRYSDIIKSILVKNGHISPSGKINVDDESWNKLLKATDASITGAFKRLRRHADLDYSPDPLEATFLPIIREPTKSPSQSDSIVSANNVFSNWVRVTSASRSIRQSTIDNFRAIFIDEFCVFLKANGRKTDMYDITKTDVVNWRDYLISTGLSATTIRGKKLAAVSAILNRAFKDGKISSNPTAGVSLPIVHHVRERVRGFTDEEAASILLAARDIKNSSYSTRMQDVIRWVPFLCAATGARITELLQLRRRDVFEQEGTWWIRITPEAGSVKNDTFRDIPLHKALSEEGFLNFVNECQKNRLFIHDLPNRRADRPSTEGTLSTLTSWVRSIVNDQRIQPNHAWRHRFTTLARECGMGEEQRSAILGHRIGGMGEVYGEMSGLVANMAKIKTDRMFPKSATRPLQA